MPYAPNSPARTRRTTCWAGSKSAFQARASDAELAIAHNRVLINDFARGLRNAIDELIAGRKKK